MILGKLYEWSGIKYTRELIDYDYSFAPKEGANIHGLFMEGARWNLANNSIAPSSLKELFPLLPVVHIKATTQDKQEVRHIYECPVYRTRCIFFLDVFIN